MDDRTEEAAVPENTDALPAAPETLAEAEAPVTAQTEPQTTTETPPTPRYVTQEEFLRAMQEGFPTIAQQIEARLADRQNRAIQSASAKGINRVMKQVIPAFKAFDSAVKRGSLDAEQAKALKTEAWLEATSEFEDVPTETDARQVQAQQIDQEQAHFRRRAALVLNEEGLSMADPEYSEVAGRTLGDDPDLAESNFRKMVKQAVEKKKVRLAKNEAETRKEKLPTPADTGRGQAVPPLPEQLPDDQEKLWELAKQRIPGLRRRLTTQQE